MYEKIADYYKKGYYKKKHVLALYRAGVLTKEQYTAICGSITV